ncbi:MAG: Flagellar protein FliT [Pseudomonadota bacterium]|jgi:iron-sulfur cluster repair protein YtfE (RIC family)
MNGYDIIASYEKILGISGQMTTAAEQSDWDRYLQFQSQLNLELSRLQTKSLANNLNSDQQETVSQLIQSIQMQINRIYQYVDASLNDLTAKIENTHTQKKLELAYKSL